MSAARPARKMRPSVRSAMAIGSAFISRQAPFFETHDDPALTPVFGGAYHRIEGRHAVDLQNATASAFRVVDR
jgi:hypothetical protein